MPLPSDPTIEVSETDSLSPAKISWSLSSIPLASESDQKPSHHPNSIAGGLESTGVWDGLRSFWHSSSPHINGGIVGLSLLIKTEDSASSTSGT